MQQEARNSGEIMCFYSVGWANRVVTAMLKISRTQSNFVTTSAKLFSNSTKNQNTKFPQFTKKNAVQLANEKLSNYASNIYFIFNI